MSEFSVENIRKAMVKRYEEKIAYLDQHGARFNDLVALLPQECIVNVDISNCCDLSVKGTKKDLTEIVRILRTNGLTPSSKAEDGKAEYYTYFRDQADESESSFRIWFAFTSTMCKRVQTGYRTENVPVYMIVCDETPTRESELAAAAA